MAGQAVRRCAIYARVSTQEQATSGTSLDVQQQRCALAIAAEGWLEVASYVDAGVSGARRNRPQLDRLHAAASRGLFDTVVVTSLDRVSRSLRDLLELLEFFESADIRLVALDGTSQAMTASSRLDRQIRGAFAEFERAVISERTLSGRLARARAGRWPGGSPPFGYRLQRAPDGTGRVLVVDDREAHALQLMASMAANGSTIAAIVSALNSAGLRPRRAEQWTYGNLRKMLRSARGQDGTWSWHPSVQADPIALAVPAILSQDQLAAATTVRSRSRHQRPKSAFLLTGMIRTPHGTSMTGVTVRGKRWYQCPGLLVDGVRRHTCGCGRIYANDLDHLVLQAFGRRTARASNPIAATEAEEPDEMTEAELLRNSVVEYYQATPRADLDQDRLLATARLLNQLLADEATAEVQSEAQAAAQLEETPPATPRAGITGDRTSTGDMAGRAERSRERLTTAGCAVEVQRWVRCDNCQGRGVLAARQAADGEARVCPQCRRTRRVAVVRIGWDGREVAPADIAVLPPSPD